MGVSRDEVVGRSTGKATITVERGPVTTFGMLDGVNATCVSYGGVVRNGRIELRSAVFFVGGRPAPWLGSAVTPYALDGELPLRASY